MKIFVTLLAVSSIVGWWALRPLLSTSVKEFSGFEIQIDLSKEAIHELTQKGESVVVMARFSGSPSDEMTGFLEELFWVDGKSGALTLGTSQIRIGPGGGLASFDRLKISSEKLKLLEHHDFDVVINVASARVSNPNNLLNCASISRRYSELITAQNRIYCDLP